MTMLMMPMTGCWWEVYDGLHSVFCHSLSFVLHPSPPIASHKLYNTISYDMNTLKARPISHLIATYEQKRTNSSMVRDVLRCIDVWISQICKTVDCWACSEIEGTVGSQWIVESEDNKVVNAKWSAYAWWRLTETKQLILTQTNSTVWPNTTTLTSPLSTPNGLDTVRVYLPVSSRSATEMWTCARPSSLFCWTYKRTVILQLLLALTFV